MITQDSLRRKSQTGFSLIELLVVIALIVIMSGIAVPRLGGAIIQSRLRTASRELLSHAQNARQSSITERANDASNHWQIRFFPSSNHYQVFRGYTAVGDQVSMPSGVKLVVVENNSPHPNPPVWAFNSFGELTLDNQSTVGLQAVSGGAIYKVGVSPAGRIRLWVDP